MQNIIINVKFGILRFEAEKNTPLSVVNMKRMGGTEWVFLGSLGVAVATRQRSLLITCIFLSTNNSRYQTLFSEFGFFVNTQHRKFSFCKIPT